MKIISEKILLPAFWASSAFVILYHFVFLRYEECFPRAYEVGQISTNLALAYISSYIFHYIVGIQKSRRDKKNINEVALKYVERLLNSGWAVYRLMANNPANQPNIYDGMTITKREFKTLCSKVNPNDLSSKTINENMLPTPMTLHRHIQSSGYHHVKYYIEKLMLLAPYLDTELIKILAELELSDFAVFFDPGNQMQFNNTDFIPWSDPMYDYILLLRKLKNFYDVSEIEHRNLASKEQSNLEQQ